MEAPWSEAPMHFWFLLCASQTAEILRHQQVKLPKEVQSNNFKDLGNARRDLLTAVFLLTRRLRYAVASAGTVTIRYGSQKTRILNSRTVAQRKYSGASAPLRACRTSQPLR
jgi:hypothetical protein